MEPLHADDPEGFGPYRLLARLGAGGMGRVYLARSPGGQAVAVKVVHADLAGDPAWRARFRREVTAAGRVSGAYTAAVIDAGPDDPSPWLVTAYLPGLSLEEAVTRYGPFPPQAVAALGAALAEGLAAVHRAGVVHRDLKPANVLLTPGGPRVIDFGVARPADAGALTRSGTAVGSPGYMSPEQAAGRETGPAGDVFSLGAVLAFAATGSGPFGSGPLHAMIYRILNETPHVDGVTDPALHALLTACLAREPERRPPVGHVLHGMLDRLPRHAAPQGTQWLPPPLAAEIAQRAAHVPQSPVRERGRRRKVSRRAVLLGAAGTVAGAGALGGIGYALDVANREHDETRYLWKHRMPEGRGVQQGPALAGGLVLVSVDGKDILALGARTGAQRWTQPLDMGTAFEITEVGGTIVVDTGSDLYGLDVRTGQRRWTRSLKGAPSHPLVATSGGLIYLAAWSGGGADGLHAIDAATGATRWHYLSDKEIPGGVAVARGTLFVGTDNAVHALDPVTGKVRWKTDIRLEATGTPEPSGGLVYLAALDSSVVALDAATGRKRWAADTDPGGGASRSGRRVTVADGTLYTAAPDGRIFALDAATGRKRWEHASGGDQGKSAALINRDYLRPTVVGGTVCALDGGQLAGLDARTGGVRWQQHYSAPSDERPVAAAGLVHMATFDGLVSLDPATGRTVARTPDFETGHLVAAGDVLYYRGGTLGTYASNTTLYVLPARR
ncbi:serine/threonine-protein kinase [Actinomadura macrotermitis]|uniref:Outer membrane protein assembly factor BamB n=1 Tax=Actinomadura macrotermitis TaxID=2585200 RepID=A0A7K0C925_9ACTN|nr:serine/threonine-protein kinase [Actinomadura macrotermitis]MQY09294.1 Outer membrane protein assembly factor BamB [Actinomadura macrotermitis]